MVDLLVITSLDQLIFIMKILFTFTTKQTASVSKSILLSLPPQLAFPETVFLVAGDPSMNEL